MERRFKRQISASSAAAFMSFNRPPNSTTNGSVALSSTAESITGSIAPASNRQLEDYCDALEEDYAALREQAEKQAEDVVALTSLVAERGVSEADLSLKETTVATLQAFLNELLTLTTEGRALRQRVDANAAVPSSSSASSGSSKPGAGGKLGKNSKPPSPSPQTQQQQQKTTSTLTGAALMDAVRDAAQKQQQKLKLLQQRSEKDRQALQAAERALAEAKRSAGSPGTDGKAPSSAKSRGGGDDCFVPSSAKELDALRQEIKKLERRLSSSEKDARHLTAELKSAQQDVKLQADVAVRYKAEMEELRSAVEQKEQLLNDATKRYRSAEKELARMTAAGVGTAALMGSPSPNAKERGTGSSRSPSAHSRSSKKPSDSAASSSGSGGVVVDTVSNSTGSKLTTTRHYRLFAGREYVELLQSVPAAFKDAFLRGTAAAVHVPYGNLSNVSLQTTSDAAAAGVAVEVDVCHSAHVSKEEVDLLLLSCSFADTMGPLKDEAAAGRPSLAEVKAAEALSKEVKQLRAALSAKDGEVRSLTQKMQRLEASLASRDVTQDAVNEEVDAVLDETAATVKELYQTLEAQRAELEQLTAAVATAERKATERDTAVQEAQQQLETTKKQLSTKQTQLRAVETKLRTLEVEKAKSAESRSADSAEQEKELQRLRGTVDDLQQQVAAQQAKECELGQALQSAKVEVHVEAFEATVKLPSPDLASVARGLVEKRDVHVLHQLLLGEASVASGTVPVQVTRCVCSRSDASLNVKMELAFTTSAAHCASVQLDVSQKLERCSFTVVVDYLRFRLQQVNTLSEREVQLQEACAAADEAEQRLRDLETTLTQQTQGQAAKASSLEEELRLVERCLRAALSSSERSAATTAHARAEVLVRRLQSAEASQKQSEAEKKELEEHYGAVQDERDDGRRQVSALEEQLKQQQKAAHEAEGVLQERLKRLENALREKAAVTDAERRQRDGELEEVQQRQAKEVAAALAAVQERERAMQEREKALQGILEETTAEVARLRQGLDDARRAERRALRHKEEQEGIVRGLQEQIASLHASATKEERDTAVGLSDAFEREALEEALRISKDELTALARHTKEVEADLRDMRNVQESLQHSLEAAQSEIRSKRQDFDLLVKQVLRMEEQEQRLKEELKQLRNNSGSGNGNAAKPSTTSSTSDAAGAPSEAVMNTLSSCVVLLKQQLRRVQAGSAGGYSPSLLDSPGEEEKDADSSPSSVRRRMPCTAAGLTKLSNEALQLSQQLSAVLKSSAITLTTTVVTGGHGTGSRSSGAAASVSEDGPSVPSSVSRRVPVASVALHTTKNSGAAVSGKVEHQEQGTTGVSSALNSKRIMLKRSSSAKTFSRTASAPYDLEDRSPVAPRGAGGSSRNGYDSLSGSPIGAGAAGGGARSPRPQDDTDEYADTNAAAAPPHVSSTSGAGVKPSLGSFSTASSAARGVDAAPRLGAGATFHRQLSARTGLTSTSGNVSNHSASAAPSAAAASSSSASSRVGVKGGSGASATHRHAGPASSATSVSSSSATTAGDEVVLTKERRRASPVAGTGTTRPKSPNVFHRSNTATAGMGGGGTTSGSGSGGASGFARTTSGYRKGGDGGAPPPPRMIFTLR